MKIIYFCLILLSFTVNAEKITVSAGIWPGFTNEDGSGIYYDLLKQIYNDRLHIIPESYHRGINAFHQNKVDIIVGVYREDVNNAILPHWYLDRDDPVVAVYRPDNITLQHINDLSNHNTSWVRGYHFERFLQSSKNDYPVSSALDGFKLLANNRIDIFIDYQFNIPAKYQGLFANIEVLPARRIYVAFQNTPLGQSLAKEFDEKMVELRSNGILEKLYGEYYANTKFSEFNENKEKIVILTDDTNLIRHQQNREFSINDTLSKSLNTIFDQLDDYYFEFKIIRDYANLAAYKHDDNLCFSDMIKTPERTKHFIYSHPSSLYLNLRLYSKTPLTPTNDKINLPELMALAPNKTLGLVAGRSYGVQLDQQINRISKQNIIEIPGQIEKILTQFNHQKFDLMLEFPQDVELAWQHFSKHPLYSYSLANSPDYVLGHMMCANTTKNAAFIEKYNQSVLQLAQSGTLSEIFAKNLPENKHKTLEKYFKKVYSSLQQSKP